MIYKTYKYKLKLTNEQSNRVDNWICTCRCIYNLALETKTEAWKKKVNISCFDLQKQLTELRREYPWINDVPIGVLQDSIERLDRAYNTFFKGGGFPKWAKKERYNSIRFKYLEISGTGFKLPKLGKVKIHKDRMPDGKLKSATIKRENGNYYLSITFESEQINTHSVSDNQAIGLDVGISYFLVDSNGCYVDNPRHTLKYEKRLRVKQRALARKQKGSAARIKAKDELLVLYTKIKNVRNDFLHKTSIQYIRNNSLIVVEDLKVKNMIRNHNLAKHISDAGWSTFFNQLDYKCKMYGKEFIKVNPAYTSQKCNSCGHIEKENRLTQSQFKCVSCGNKDNADFNASKNILGEGIALVRKREALACA